MRVFNQGSLMPIKTQEAKS